MVKEIVLEFYEKREITIQTDKLNNKAKKFIKAVFTDDDERTDEQWDIVENYNFSDILHTLGFNSCDEIEVIDFH